MYMHCWSGAEMSSVHGICTSQSLSLQQALGREQSPPLGTSKPEPVFSAETIHAWGCFLFRFLHYQQKTSLCRKGRDKRL